MQTDKNGHCHPLLLVVPHRARRTLAMATLMNAPRWGQPAVGAGLRWGQSYGTPLFFGFIEESGEGYFGDQANAKWPTPATEASSHPDSPVFRNTQPKP